MHAPVESTPTRLRDLTPQQRRSGLAAWLGWMFDGMDMHLYTLVALPFVAELMRTTVRDPSVSQHGAMINAAFLVGWAVGGAFFGRIGDRLGRSRALILTILTYACFTGLSALAQEWWHLLIFRFLSALGIGGEWAVGASLLSETWPKKWRPWIAATLQTGVNLGVLLACVAGWAFSGQSPRWIFLVGILPALLTLWIRKAVPETEEWQHAKKQAPKTVPGIRDLFSPAIRGVTLRVLLICGVSLTAHWTFLFWQQAYIRNHPAIVGQSDAVKNHAAVVALMLIMVGSIIGNYLSAWIATFIGYRKSISLTLAMYFVVMLACFSKVLSYEVTLAFFFLIGMCQGVFGLFTMCLPPLFPTLLRTTGAGFCYNFGRIAAAGGTVFFGIFNKVGDYRLAFFYAAFLFAPAALCGLLLPEPDSESQ
jgi:MFS family permease